MHTTRAAALPIRTMRYGLDVMPISDATRNDGKPAAGQTWTASFKGVSHTLEVIAGSKYILDGKASEPYNSPSAAGCAAMRANPNPPQKISCNGWDFWSDGSGAARKRAAGAQSSARVLPLAEAKAKVDAAREALARAETSLAESEAMMAAARAGYIIPGLAADNAEEDDAAADKAARIAQAAADAKAAETARTAPGPVRTTKAPTAAAAARIAAAAAAAATP